MLNHIYISRLYTRSISRWFVTWTLEHSLTSSNERWVPSALLATVLSLFIFLTSSWAQVPGEDEATLARIAHCEDVPYIAAIDEEEEGPYLYAAWIYDCASNEKVLVVSPRTNVPFELDRRPSTGGEGLEVTFVNIGTIGSGIATTIWYEFLTWYDNYLLRVYSLDDRRQLLEAWSYNRPIIENLDENPATDFVIFQDALRSGDPVVRGWPVVLGLEDKGASVKTLRDYPNVVQRQLSMAEKRFAELDVACSLLPEPCLWGPTIEILQSQIMAFRIALGTVHQ